MIFTCDRAKAVWSSIGLGQKIADLLIVDRSGSIVLEEVIRGEELVQGLDVGLAELILTGGWFLWWERRQIVHGESVQRPARSGLSIVSLTKNYKQAAGMVTQIRQGWRKPPEDFLMVNVDASYDENRDSGSTGVIIRDCSGDMIVAASRYIPQLMLQWRKLLL